MASRKKLNRAFVVAAALLLIALTILFRIEKPKSAEPPSFLLGGIQVNEDDHEYWAEALKYSGMNTVSVTVYAKQGDWESDNLWYEDEEPAVVAEIRTAIEQDLNVVLILRVALDHAYTRNAFFWHGMILPKTDELLHSWFGKYGDFVGKWARIAEEEGVQVLAIGSEMNALSATKPVDEIPNLYTYYLDSLKQEEYKAAVLANEEKVADWQWSQGPTTYVDLEAYLDARAYSNAYWAHQHSYADMDSIERLETINARSALLNELWIGLIDRCRSVYSGQLAYAANFDNYYDVGFWDHLDVMGINAYFPLREVDSTWQEAEYSYDSLVVAWKEIFRDIERIQEEESLREMPLLFTELGYTFRENSSLQPWAGFGFSVVGHPENKEMIVWPNQPLSYFERRDAIQALYEANATFEPNPLSGLLYWKLTTRRDHYNIEPFVVQIGEYSSDPTLPALARFTVNDGD